MYRTDIGMRKSPGGKPSIGILHKIQDFFFNIFSGKRKTIRNLRNSIPENLAEFFGCGDQLIRRMANSPGSHYRKFFLWKDREHTRKRWIEAPDPELKAIQKRILALLYQMAPSPQAHGFATGRGIVSNARVHTGKRYIVKLDLKDFFPSITRSMILKQWNDSGLITPENRIRMETLLNLCLLENRLPQGAPTSPAISNLVCRRLDFILAKFARHHKMKYTRYADDLTFSSDSDSCYRLIPVIRRIVEQYGFRINERKVNVLKRHQRQTVTGLVVNQVKQTSVPRRKRLKLRAFVHQIIAGKIPLNEFNYAKLKGHVSLIRMANPKQGEYFRRQLEIIEKMRKNA